MLKRNKAKWLNRRISPHGPYLTLCMSESEYLQAARHIKIKSPDSWMSNDHCNATAHAFSMADGSLACIVCLRGWEDYNLTETIGLLVHEAVHVWQRWCDYYGEEKPAVEQEAYAVQSISQELIDDFFQRLSGTNQGAL